MITKQQISHMFLHLSRCFADKCENCFNNAFIHIDFELPLEKVSNGKLSVWVEPLDHSLFGDHFPHKMMGNPTVNVRLLLSNE